MLRLKSDLLPALLATADGVLGTFDLRWHDDAALTVVMAAKGYPGDYAKGTEIRGLEAARAVPGVEIFHAGTRRDGDRLLATGGRVLVRHGARQDGGRGAGARLRGGARHRLARRVLPHRHRLAGGGAREGDAHERDRRSFPRLRRAPHQDGRRRDLRAHRRLRSAAAAAARLSADARVLAQDCARAGAPRHAGARRPARLRRQLGSRRRCRAQDLLQARHGRGLPGGDARARPPALHGRRPRPGRARRLSAGARSPRGGARAHPHRHHADGRDVAAHHGGARHRRLSLAVPGAALSAARDADRQGARSTTSSTP